MRKPNSRARRLCVWFSLNLIVFLACYLNYLLQLKHRYLYRTLNIGLCLSRAAAMVINFNLLLVWLPMCKYSLTKLACLANHSLRRHRDSSALARCAASSNQLQSVVCSPCGSSYSAGLRSQLLGKLKWAARRASSTLNQLIFTAKMNTITTFSMAVDHCKPLHTVCATTITIASVVHTVAHLMNVVNFSRNYDPFLGNLNMADYKGQSPLHLLISVPGITGILMMIILLLMSLSSVDFIRNSSYDLFQIFHRLSILFVILLFIHPASHVIKEQSNVDKHHPEVCYSMMVSLNGASHHLNDTSLVSHPHQLFNSTASPIKQKHKRATSDPPPINATTTTTTTITSLAITTNHKKPSVTTISTTSQKNDLKMQPLNSIQNKHNSLHKIRNGSSIHSSNKLSSSSNKQIVLVKLNTAQPETNRTATRATGEAGDWWHKFCRDKRPLFVAQSSVCWYVLSIGLSCYLFDLLVRRLRRSKSSIELLEVRFDRENNLIELILSNNHKRFLHWQPGQFVYLNCPQIAVYEWHPFTISSMDHRLGHFSLHIKTVGDWTRKLREKLEHIHGPMSSFNEQPAAVGQHHQQLSCDGGEDMKSGFYANNKLIGADWFQQQANSSPKSTAFFNYTHERGSILPSLDCYNRKGRLQVECTKLVHMRQYSELLLHQQQQPLHKDQEEDVTSIDLANHQQPKELYCISEPTSPLTNGKTHTLSRLHLYIDGPFHSPFERLLEQQVSVCIANGVGWTAFSPIFHYILSDLATSDNYSRLNLYRIKQSSENLSIVSHTIGTTKEGQPEQPKQPPSASRLHLMVVVASIEQLRPFYSITLDYFRQIQAYYERMQSRDITTTHNDHLNPVKEITAFITRATALDITVKEFCEQEKLSLDCDADQASGEGTLRVNDRFTIRFGKPKFDVYLKSCASSHSDSSKISVYCCGSYQVKKEVKGICKSMNRLALKQAKAASQFLSYHEENF